MARAGGAGLRLGARLGAGARAGLASQGGRHLDGRRLALEGVLQHDFHVVAQVGAALAAIAAAAARAPAAEATEQIVENVGHGGGETIAAKAPRPAPALLEGGMAEAVIGGALVLVGEGLIGLVDFLELDLGLLVARVAVGMMLHGRLAEGRFQLRFRTGAGHAEEFVVISLGHINGHRLKRASAGRGWRSRRE